MGPLLVICNFKAHPLSQILYGAAHADGLDSNAHPPPPPCLFPGSEVSAPGLIAVLSIEVGCGQRSLEPTLVEEQKRASCR